MKAVMISLALLTVATGCKKSSTSAALSADDDHITDYSALEATTTATFTSKVPGRPDMEIAYQIYRNPNAKASIMMLSGFTENYFAYKELIGDLYSQGYSLYIMDNRGMGSSGRDVADRQIVYVDAISDYVADALTFATTIVKAGGDTKTMLFAHSTGGLIGLNLVTQHPELFSRVLFNSPLVKILEGKEATPEQRTQVDAVVAAGQGKAYGPGGADMVFDKYTFETQTTTHSRARFQVGWQLLRDQEKLRMGGASFGFIKAVADATAGTASLDLAPKLTMPVLITDAGEDTYVSVAAHNKLCAAAPNCQIYFEPKARHEIFRETDDIRSRLLQHYFDFFAK